MLEEIVQFIRHYDRFAITSHARPDGDSIGSELGLGLAFEALGKSITIVNVDPIPRAYRWLPGAQKVFVQEYLEGNWDAVFVLECNDLNRTGVQNLDGYSVINIDHHPRTKPFGKLNWVDPGAAAAAEMVYWLICELNVNFTPEIATNLYAAILTDTGSFRFPNTKSATFDVAARLIDFGADPARIAQEIYMNQPRAKLALLVKVLDTLVIHSSGKIASIHLSLQMLDDVGASEEDTEGLVNYALGIEGVQIAAFFRREEGESHRVSLRSKGPHDVGSVATLLGGGGHRNAAGLSLKGEHGAVEQEVLSHLEGLLHMGGT